MSTDNENLITDTEKEPVDETELALAAYIDSILQSGKTPRIKYRRNYASVNGRRFYYDDDGRTVAPMKNVEGILRGVRSGGDGDSEKQEEGRNTLRGLSKKSARSFTLGSLLAALAVAAAFIGGTGLLIWLLTVIWT